MRRPVRVRLPGMPSATIRFGDGQRSSARLQTISVTGGLLRVLKPLSPGAVVELMFSSHIGPVLAMAELLSPCSAAPIGLQPFRWTRPSCENYALQLHRPRRWKQKAHLRPLWLCSQQTGDVVIPDTVAIVPSDGQSRSNEAESSWGNGLAWIDTTESLNLTGLNNRKRSVLKIMVQLWSSNSFSVL